MASYYVNKEAQSNGDHEVHVSTCHKLPLPQNRLYLGEFASCHGAVQEARKHYTRVDGCYYCCNACHHS